MQSLLLACVLFSGATQITSVTLPDGRFVELGPQDTLIVVCGNRTDDEPIIDWSQASAIRTKAVAPHLSKVSPHSEFAGDRQSILPLDNTAPLAKTLTKSNR